MLTCSLQSEISLGRIVLAGGSFWLSCAGIGITFISSHIRDLFSEKVNLLFSIIMFYKFYQTLLHSGIGYTVTAQNPSTVVSPSFKYLSSDANQHSFTLSYLINTCGLSQESALSASKTVRFKTPEKPDLLLTFFKKIGFSKTQISQIIQKCPKLLSLNPEKIIFPKVEYFHSKGTSTPHLVRIFTTCPWILFRSLEKHLVPCFNFYRELFQSEEKAIAAFRRSPSIIYHGFKDVVMCNINTLRENGVPAANILLLVQYHPRKIIMNSNKFAKLVEDVREMGFNHLRSQFILAIAAFSLGDGKLIRDQKVVVYKRWGWSDKDIIAAFKKHPLCMTFSEDKIMGAMDFYVNQLGLDPSVIANRPLLLSLSLKKRLIPRAAVMQFLSAKGLFKLDSSKTKLFECTEKYFLEKFVNCREEAPYLLKMYNEKLDLLQKEKENM